MANWLAACAADDVANEDLIRFDHGDRTFAIYRSPDDEYYCTDGLCTHEQVHLEEGLVVDHVIECPKHNGRFDYRTGEAKGAPRWLREPKAFPGHQVAYEPNPS